VSFYSCFWGYVGRNGNFVLVYGIVVVLVLVVRGRLLDFEDEYEDDDKHMCRDIKDQRPWFV